VGDAMKIIAEPEWHGSYLDEDGQVSRSLLGTGTEGRSFGFLFWVAQLAACSA